MSWQRNDWDTQSFYNRSWKRVPDLDKFKSPDYGIKMIQRGSYAYHTQPDVSYPTIERTFNNMEICELTEVHLIKLVTMFVVGYNNSLFELQKIGLASTYRERKIR